MTMDSYHFLILMQVISIVALVIGAVYLFIRWRSREYSYLFLFDIATLINNIGYLLEMTASDSNSALLGTRVAYLGKVFIPFTFLMFVLQYCEICLSRAIKVAMTCFHVLIVVLVFTCRYQKLFYTSITYTTEGVFPHNVYGHGIMYNIYTGVLFLYLAGILIVIICHMHRDTRRKRRMQMYYLIACSLCAIAGFVIFLSGISKGYDTTSVSYMISLVLMAIALTKYDLLDTLELVRDYVTDNLSAGIIALDEDDRVIYSNRTALSFYPSLKTDGEAIASRLIEAYRNHDVVTIDNRVYQPEYKELTKNDEPRGHIMILSDITDNYHYTKLMKKMTETDALTGLLNRFAYEYALSELKKQSVLPKDLVIFSIDVNGLKNVNDTLGHSAGDAMICDASGCIVEAVGNKGNCYRTGGDEFAVILTDPDSDPETIRCRINESADALTKTRPYPFSISVGYCAADGGPGDQIESIEEQADKMMYREKENFYLSSGINRRAQSEAFGALCENYIKIIQADLSTEQYKIIKMDLAEQTASCGFAETLGLWLRAFAESGMVAENYRVVFLAATQPSRLKKHFQRGEKRVCIPYIRKVGKAYRRVMMEVIPARNYTPDTLVIYLYVKETGSAD